MVKNKRKLHLVAEPGDSDKKRDEKGKLEGDVDALFKLPLAEFIVARNALATALKKAGRKDEAAQLKILVKPSVSAWTVNQLYWDHRDVFDQLIESGARFHKAQSSSTAGKLADMRGALDAQRKALAQLSELATSVLRDAGHNSTPDTIHRIATTLQAMSAYTSRPGAPRPGHLTHDVDPPGFESLAAFIPGATMSELPYKESRMTTAQKSHSAPKSEKSRTSTPAPNKDRKLTPVDDSRQLEATRRAKLAAAKSSLQEAREILIEARDKQRSLQMAQKKVDADVREAEKQRRAAEERLEKARAAAEAAAQHARAVAVEIKQAAKSVENATRAEETASEELETLLEKSSAG